MSIRLKRTCQHCGEPHEVTLWFAVAFRTEGESCQFCCGPFDDIEVEIRPDPVPEGVYEKAPSGQKGQAAKELKGSRGGVESRHTGKTVRQTANLRVNGPDEKGEAGARPAQSRGMDSRDSVRPSGNKRGRLRIVEKRDKPWLDAKPPMSRTTWYRRKAEGKK